MIESPNPSGVRSPTPQALIFTILGTYCLETNPAIPTNTYLEILAKVGVNEHAARMTLARMRERGYLNRERKGREAFWSATELAFTVVRRQRRWTFTERTTLPDPDGVWTIFTFSLPDSRRRDRDQLRQRLAWEGFGPLRDGVWISPGDRDLTEVMNPGHEEAIDEFVEAFVATPKLVDIQKMIARAWHLPELYDRYQEFLADWDTDNPASYTSDELGLNLLLVTSWRQLARETPHLTQKYLPAGWPAHRCMEVFLKLERSLAPRADRIFAKLLADSGIVLVG